LTEWKLTISPWSNLVFEDLNIARQRMVPPPAEVADEGIRGGDTFI
jgi:hypothetical protein